jgi:hypothetical protein
MRRISSVSGFRGWGTNSSISNLVVDILNLAAIIDYNERAKRIERQEG